MNTLSAVGIIAILSCLLLVALLIWAVYSPTRRRWRRSCRGPRKEESFGVLGDVLDFDID